MNTTPSFYQTTPLICPYCGSEFLHHDEVTVYNRRGEDAQEGLVARIQGSGVMLKTSQEGNPSSRRSGLTIHFWCEGCEHIPVLTIVQHKGVTFVEWANS